MWHATVRREPTRRLQLVHRPRLRQRKRLKISETTCWFESAADEADGEWAAKFATSGINCSVRITSDG